MSKTVPDEPTEEMERKGFRALADMDGEISQATVNAIWTVMLAAAPAGAQRNATDGFGQPMNPAWEKKVRGEIELQNLVSASPSSGDGEARLSDAEIDDKEIIRAIRDSGAKDREWAALTHAVGPYEIDKPNVFTRDFVNRICALAKRGIRQQGGEICVKDTMMEESNGRKTYSVFLAKVGDDNPFNWHQVYSDSLEGSAKYEAAKLRHFLGQGDEPNILDFDTDEAEQRTAAQVAPRSEVEGGNVNPASAPLSREQIEPPIVRDSRKFAHPESIEFDLLAHIDALRAHADSLQAEVEGLRKILTWVADNPSDDAYWILQVNEAIGRKPK